MLLLESDAGDVLTVGLGEELAPLTLVENSPPDCWISCRATICLPPTCDDPARTEVVLIAVSLSVLFRVC